MLPRCGTLSAASHGATESILTQSHGGHRDFLHSVFSVSLCEAMNRGRNRKLQPRRDSHGATSSQSPKVPKSQSHTVSKSSPHHKPLRPYRQAVVEQLEEVHPRGPVPEGHDVGGLAGLGFEALQLHAGGVDDAEANIP